MKREDLISLLVYGLMVVVAVLVGFFVIAPLFTQLQDYLPGSGDLNMLFAFVFVLVSVIFNVFYLELGHIVGAKIGGYSIFSVNIIGLCWYRADKKWKFRFKNFDGLTGETRIAPKKEKTSPKPFALAPLFFYMFEVLVCMVIFYLISDALSTGPGVKMYGHLSWVPIQMIMMITIGGMLELYNIFPAKLDSTTDGYRLVILSKKENFAAYNELMRIEYAYSQNVELSDMKVFDQITDFTVQVNLYTVYRYFKQKNFTEAEKLLDHMIENKKNLKRENYCPVIAQKLYLLLLNKPVEEVKPYYDAHVSADERRYIANDISMESIRAYLLISSMLDISEHEARFAMSRVDKALKRTIPGRAEIEKELYQVALNKADQVRPEWHIKELEVK
ncbi:MAG: hypothetical protein MJ207_00715 [Bacilli bacterium]|nr:hypothetical protein [Bacilli bacterium]